MILVTLGGSEAAGAQTAKSCDRAVEATVVFVGRVIDVSGSTVAYRVMSVPSGEVEADRIEVDYPDGANADFLEAGSVYRVGSNLDKGQYRSIVPTATDECVGTVRTMHGDGSAIDTGTFVEISERLPGIARTLAIILVGALIVLIGVGRLFDRPQAYR